MVLLFTVAAPKHLNCELACANTLPNMTARDYDMTFSYNELSNVGTVEENVVCDIVRENLTHDEQANSSGNSYLLSRSSSLECVKVNHTKQASVQLNRYHMRSSSKRGLENIHHSSSEKCKRKSPEMHNNKITGGKESCKGVKKDKRKLSKIKMLTKSHKPTFKTKMCEAYNSKSSVVQKSNDKELTFLDPVADTDLLVSEWMLPTRKNSQNITKTNTIPIAPMTSPSQLIKPTTSNLLSMMADAVSALKHTPVQASRFSMPSDYPECPTRSTWPLLREMIAKPSVSVVSISSASRQTLSTVLVDTINSEKPKANVISKLDKEIRCECKFNKGEPCWVLFQEDRLRKERLHHLTLKRESLDLVILAKIAANINREEKTKKHCGQDRQRCRVCYYHEGRQICRETFMFIHGICKGRLCALMQHYKKKGLSVRVHGNKSNVPQHALSYTDSERVLDFIREYANDHSISTFGRKPGSKAGGGLLIMSPTQSKLYVHHRYKVWCLRNSHRAVSLRSFQNLWTKHLPYIVVLRGSNKHPVPVHKSGDAVLELLDHKEHGNKSVSVDKSSLPIINNVNHTDDTVKDSQTQHDHCIRVVHCGTNTPLNLYSVGRKKTKRKLLPPRKIKPSVCQPPNSTGHNFRHNETYDDSHTVLTPALNSKTPVEDNSSDDIIQNTLGQSDSHHAMFSSDIHFPQSTCTSPLQDHPTTEVGFQNQAEAARVKPTTLTTDMVYSCKNKTLIPMSEPASLHPSLFMSQSSLLSDSYSMQALDRFVPQISGSHVLGDQSQTMLHSQPGSEFPNLHQIDWQTWQTYNTL